MDHSYSRLITTVRVVVCVFVRSSKLVSPIRRTPTDWIRPAGELGQELLKVSSLHVVAVDVVAHSNQVDEVVIAHVSFGNLEYKCWG